MNRQEINRIILKKLVAINESCPNLRFFQLLAVARVIIYTPPSNEDIIAGKGPVIEDLFNEESSVTLKRTESNK